MFKRSTDRIAKLRKPSKRLFRSDATAKLREQINIAIAPPPSTVGCTSPNGAMVTLVVGPEQRLFAAHEDVLTESRYFANALKTFSKGCGNRRLALVDQEPEVMSAVLQFLHKGDYSPRLLHDKKRDTWVLEDHVDLSSLGSNQDSQQTGAHRSATIFCSKTGQTVLRDTVLYCAADRFGLDGLKRLALRKQGLQTNIDVATILRSARYAYEHTPDTDARLRAHYLALIIRSGQTFKRSGTMQMEMAAGGKMFFDLFVAMCNHIDDLSDGYAPPTPKSSPCTI